MLSWKFDSFSITLPIKQSDTKKEKEVGQKKLLDCAFCLGKKNNETSLQNPKLSYDDMNEGAESEALQFYLANQLDPLA